MKEIIRLNNKKAVAFAMAFLLFITFPSNAQTTDSVVAEPKVDLYFALGDKHGFPSKDRKESFDCTDKIYAALTLNNFDKNNYTVSFTWIDPAGQEREKTEYPFTVVEKTTSLWSWLSLSRARGAGMIQWINPAAGLEEFIGPWKVEIRIGNKKVASEELEITC